MAVIPINQARAIFTSMLVDVYRDMPVPKSFLRSFFPTVAEWTKYVSIQVERNGEPIAVDVARGSEGNRNTFSKSTEKIFEPPFYREFLDATELDLYDRAFGSTAIDDGIFTQLLQVLSERLRQLQNKIERAYELQCAQALQTGIVTVKNGTNIDFKRQAGSLVDKGSGAYWDAATVSPYDDLEAGCNFIRQKGKSQGAVFNAIMGATAYQNFLKNTIVKGRNDLKMWSLDNIVAQQRDSTGASLHGRIDAGSYSVNLWTYPEFYDDAAGTSTPYIDPKKVILLPENPRFKLAFAAVPMLMKAGSAVENGQLPAPVRGAFIIGDYIDERNTAHIFDVKSAGVAIPTAVDQIYTVKVVA